MQSLQGSVELLPRLGGGPLSGLGRQEERLSVPPDPIPNPLLRFAVTGGRIHVVNAVRQREVQRGVGFVLRYLPKRRRAQNRPGADVAGTTEWLLVNHEPVSFLLC